VNDLFNNLKNELQQKSCNKNEIEAKVFNLRDKLKLELQTNGRITNTVIQKKTEVAELKKYDVVYCDTFATSHYLVVYKVKDNRVFCCPITSKEKHSIHQIKNDRVFYNNYISKGTVEYDLEECRKNFVRVYENKREMDLIFKKIKDYYKGIFNL
jgi:hypothetical protein